MQPLKCYAPGEPNENAKNIEAAFNQIPPIKNDAIYEAMQDELSKIPELIRQGNNSQVEFLLGCATSNALGKYTIARTTRQVEPNFADPGDFIGYHDPFREVKNLSIKTDQPKFILHHFSYEGETAKTTNGTEFKLNGLYTYIYVCPLDHQRDLKIKSGKYDANLTMDLANDFLKQMHSEVPPIVELTGRIEKNVTTNSNLDQRTKTYISEDDSGALVIKQTSEFLITGETTELGATSKECFSRMRADLALNAVITITNEARRLFHNFPIRNSNFKPEVGNDGLIHGLEINRTPKI